MFQNGEIALGQYHNVDDTIYSGTVILEKSKQRGFMKPRFFQKGDPQINESLWEYFEDKHKNRIRVKKGIKSIKELQSWMNAKRKHLKA